MNHHNLNPQSSFDQNSPNPNNDGPALTNAHETHAKNQNFRNFDKVERQWTSC
jgi:hypothetical protein